MHTIKWVTVEDLNIWSKQKVAQQDLPRLVRDLIMQSGTITNIRAPKGDEVFRPGFDLFVESLDAKHSAFLPLGKSIWEAGVEENYLQKAEDDYQKRSKQQGLDLSEHTFVFVSTRTWNKETARKKEDRISVREWEAKKRQDKIFKDVKYIDAQELQHWINLIPPIASRFARFTLNKMPKSGIVSIDEFWQAYSEDTSPALVEEVLLAGRESQNADILSNIVQGAPTYLCGETSEEVVAFICSIIRKSKDENVYRLRDRALIINTEEAAEQLSHLSDFIFIIHKDACQKVGHLRNKNIVICAYNMNGGMHKDAITLLRPSITSFADALEVMGYNRDVAVIKASSCAGLIVVLRWQLRSPAILEPPWAKNQDLLPAVLAGGWNSKVESDKKILTTLSNKDSYDSFERTILPTFKLDDRPLQREGTVWQVRAPLYALAYLHDLMVESDWKKLEEVCSTVFSEMNKQLAKPEADQEYFRSADEFSHSNWLRDGLATTLLVIAAFHEEFKIIIPHYSNPQLYVDNIVRSLPGLEKDYRVIASLGRALPYLAEASPTPFLNALDRLLEGEGKKLEPILKEKESYITPITYHTDLLWALETLAWDPQFLPRVTNILGKMSRIDAGGRISNRPINSLRDIFLPWYPCSNATVEERLKVLQDLKLNQPIVAWELFLLLLPKRHDSSSGNAKPRFKLMGAEGKEKLTYGVVWTSNKEIMRLSLQLANRDPVKLSKIISAMSHFDLDIPECNLKEMIFCHLEKMTKNNFKDKKSLVWAALRDEINWAKNRGKIATHDKIYNKFEDLLKRIEPIEIAKKVGWLFDDYSPELPNKINEEKISEQIDRARAKAIKSLVREENLEELIFLAKNVKLPQLLAQAIFLNNPSMNFVTKLFDEGAPNIKLSNFIWGLSIGASRKFKTKWSNWLFKKHKEKSYKTEIFVRPLLGLPDTLTTWHFVEKFGSAIDKKFWKAKHVFIDADSHAEQEFTIEKCIKYGLALSAINAIFRDVSAVKPEKVFKILDMAVREINGLQGNLNTLTVHYIEEIFAKLYVSESVDINQLAQREYAYLNLLRHDKKPLAIFKLIGQDPAFYFSFLETVFRPTSAINTPKIPLSEIDQKRADAAFKILMDYHDVPGADAEGKVDKDFLVSWIADVVALALEKDREDITWQYIGHILAHSQEDHGIWPQKSICEIIELYTNEHLGRGIMVERFNMRGVHGRSLYEGGKQERELAEKYMRWARANSKYYRTASLLQAIARSWENHAKDEDERARQDLLRSFK